VEFGEFDFSSPDPEKWVINRKKMPIKARFHRNTREFAPYERLGIKHRVG
jgi:hypothetical protein